MAQVDTKNGTDLSVERQNGNTSAVYAGKGLFGALPSTPSPAETAPQPTSQVFDFKKSGDSAQVWATMGSSGRPYLFTYVHGQASGAGAVTWTAKIFPTASQPRLIVRFTNPRVRVTGAFEQEGPARWQSKLKWDLMVDGHPVSHTEVLRINELEGTAGGGNNCTEGDQRAHYLMPFGPITLLSADDPNDFSSKGTHTWHLGNFPAGKEVEISLTFRIDSRVMEKCCKKKVNGVDELFCTSGAALLEWDNDLIPVQIYAGPQAN